MKKQLPFELLTKPSFSSILTKSLSALVFTLVVFHSQAQTISGVVNDYVKVTAIDGKTLTVSNVYSSLANFDAGKKVILIQMKGASIDVSNTSTFGTINSTGNAGNYEFSTVSSRSGSTIVLTSLSRSYSVAGAVQLISVPQYTNATISAKLTAVAWDSTLGRGGVLAAEVVNALTMSANVDVSGLGFKGGVVNSVASGSSHISTVYTANSTTGYAGKGEGIASTPLNQEYARAPLANGGGGGNVHNAGGAGGSNLTAGGIGGKGYIDASVGTDYGPGMSGKVLSYSTSTNKIYLGGGGGGGQQNNSKASTGGNGGGIIVLRAGSLVTTGPFSILANGNNVSANTGNDGAGGGGAGGAVLLEVGSYGLSATNTLTVQANGGNGGLVDFAGALHGGGGGGGTGIIMHNKSAVPANASFTSTPGVAGQDCNTCTTPSAGAGTSCDGNCALGGVEMYGNVNALPIELISFKATLQSASVLLQWQTATETNNAYFTVERSVNGRDFQAIASVEGKGNSRSVVNYQEVDQTPLAGLSYYRLKQTDKDGQSTYSKIVALHNTNEVASSLSFYPNPVNTNGNLTLTSTSSAEEEVRITILNLVGDKKYEQAVFFSANQTAFVVETAHLTPGVYMITLASASQTISQRLLVR